MFKTVKIDGFPENALLEILNCPFYFWIITIYFTPLLAVNQKCTDMLLYLIILA